jgi:hypothetical protein
MKAFTAILAIVLGLCVCSSAAAAATYQDLRNPDQVAPPRGHVQDLRSPDRVAPVAVDVTAPTTAPAPASTDANAAGGGLGTLWIVLISVVGAVLLAAGGYATTRVAHAHRHAAI